MSIPIVLMTYERLDYFKQTLESLEKSNADLTNLIIFDDGTKDPEKIKYLHSLKRLYDVRINKENLGTMTNTCLALEYANSKGYVYTVYLQDDIVLNKDWLEIGLEMYRDSTCENDIAIFSLFNLDENERRDFTVLNCGHPGGVGWIVNNKWWGEYREKYNILDQGIDKIVPNDKKNHHKVKHLCDYKLSLRVYDMGWKIGKIGKSVIQHIGKESTLSNRDMSKHCFKKNFIGE